MTDKQINGTKSEILAQYYLVNKGYWVSKPINDFLEYDFIADDNKGHIYRIQVKTIYFDNSKQRWLASCVTSHKRSEGIINKKYSINSFDYGLFICKECNAAYFIPIDLIAERRSITFYPDEKNIPINSKYENFEKYKDKIL